MAATDQENLLSSAQVHIPMCEKHGLPIDLTCEDCDEFICLQCAKTDHKYQHWKTISTAGSLKRRELKKTLRKVKEEDMKAMDERIQRVTKLMENNQQSCDSEVYKLHKHYDAIVSKLDGIKKKLQTNLRESLERKNAEVIEKKLYLERKTEEVMDLVKFLENRHGSMSDYSLIDNLRDLTSLVSESDTDSEIEKGDRSVRYRKGDISEGLLESMMGEKVDLDDINVTERNSFQYNDNEDNVFVIVRAINEVTCFVKDDSDSKCIELINIKNKKKEKFKFNINVHDICIIENTYVYATDYESNSIVCLSPSGSVFTVCSTDPLIPAGICQSTEWGLLVTLRDTKSEPFQPDSHSRRLVRHVTLAGDVIREYEYQEYSKTRLFTVPTRVSQNGNNDICVVNGTSGISSELVILSLSGSLKSVYRGKDVANCLLIDALCDSHYNIIVCEMFYRQIHLLSPYGAFLKYLMTETEVTRPTSMSLYKSTLWVGNENGLLKVFQYKS